MRLLKVLNEDLTSPFQSFQFELGKKYVCSDFDTSDTGCSTGFYATDFNGLVYSLNKDGNRHGVFEVEVGGRSKEFNQFKRRFEEMTVVRQLSEEEIKAGLLACEASEGYKVLEACYPVHPFSIEPIPLEEALVLLKKWTLIRASVKDSVRASVKDSVRASVWGSAWDSVMSSVWCSVESAMVGSVVDSVVGLVWASVWTYISSLFPNVKQWRYIEHAEGANPFQSGIDLWNGGYMLSFYGNVWRLHTKNGIAWEGTV